MWTTSVLLMAGSLLAVTTAGAQEYRERHTPPDRGVQISTGQRMEEGKVFGEASFSGRNTTVKVRVEASPSTGEQAVFVEHHRVIKNGVSR